VVGTTPSSPPVAPTDVEEAYERIRDYVHETQLLRSQHLDALCDAEVFFKAEHLQKAGAFKTRGAVNAVMSLDALQASKGVATHSSGNHGGALARAAQLRGIPAHVVMPSNAVAVKQAAVLAYGGEVIECEPTLEAREAALREAVARTGAHFVPPYDDDRIIAGQGTAMLEVIRRQPDIDCCIVPVGGGGLLAGSAVVAAAHGIGVYGAEPEGADDAYRSFESGERVTTHVPDTIADGLLTTLGERNFELIRRHATGILLISDEEIREAMRLIWTRLKQVVEPSAAVTLAAIVRNPGIFRDKRVVAVLTGGNVDLDRLPFR